jgi:hypothetical protein
MGAQIKNPESTQPLCVFGDDGINDETLPPMQVYETTANNLIYHKDWNWLMRAYRKCKMIADKFGLVNGATKLDSIEVDIHCAVTTVNIQKTWKYVVEFVECYNSEFKDKLK